MIQARGLTVRMEGRTVLDGLSFRLDQRRIGIAGRNGSGKTTLARAIAGLVAPETGRVRVCGIDPARDRRRAIATIGIVFQNPDRQIIFPTVAEELAFGLRQLRRPDPEGAARTVLSRAGRADWADRPIDGLSQGQRHLVCILAVLAMEPVVIVLDEPFAGLDLPTARQLAETLDGLPQQTVLVSHDLAALGRTERVIWLERGRIAGDGPPARVLPAYECAMADPDRDAFADSA